MALISSLYLSNTRAAQDPNHNTEAEKAPFCPESEVWWKTLLGSPTVSNSLTERGFSSRSSSALRSDLGYTSEISSLGGPVTRSTFSTRLNLSTFADFPIQGLLSLTSASSPASSVSQGSSPIGSFRSGYSDEIVYETANDARAKQPTSQNSFSGTSPKSQDSGSVLNQSRPADYCCIRRAQERIKRQQPDKRPRFDDWVDYEAERLAEAISASCAAFVCKTEEEEEEEWEEEFRFSSDPHFPEEMQELTKFEGLSIVEVPVLACDQPSWSSGWNHVLDDCESGDECLPVPAIHAPRAVRPVTQVVRDFELTASLAYD
ncbi:hypothetical protein D9757_005905 [Collybiopsis confluens]|uniref:Uncharacterized protein n=1 Tax=Collybiopsis confluens TaxID=2823264 RepID=A0A8H5HNF7_9AGAR|nr:hypothetical protein D9757_005905 [Collybiopsis confluens]